MNIIDKVKSNNPIAFKVIKNAIENNKVSHAYLFSAPKNTLIEDAPTLLAQSLININPFENQDIQDINTYSDFQVIDGTNGLIKKEIVIRASSILQETTLDQRGIKILLIKNVENGNKQSLNSLLKFIEEPTSNTYIIMTTNNISHVLSTIRSRAQIVNLKSTSIKNKMSEIENNGINHKYSRVLASISKNPKEANEIFESDFKTFYKELINIMKSAIDFPEKIVTSLSQFIKRGNTKVSVSLLRTFIDDIWKSQQGFEISFVEEEELIKSYSDKNFNFQDALIIINDFIESLDWHVNFELYKIQMLIKLGRCYE